MSVRDTSKLAYKEVTPKIGERQQAVLNAIRVAKRPVNNQEIAGFLGAPINTVTPRTNELVGLGKVKLAFKAVFPLTMRKVCYWEVDNES